jgi:hypothetical protein
MNEQEILELSLIVNALQRQPSNWRTAAGIAEDTGLPVGKVEFYLRTYPDLFKESTASLGGISLYTIQNGAAPRSLSQK